MKRTVRYAKSVHPYGFGEQEISGCSKKRFRRLASVRALPPCVQRCARRAKNPPAGF
jgi:hypothetical protein